MPRLILVHGWLVKFKAVFKSLEGIVSDLFEVVQDGVVEGEEA